jgi:hypothetical protein
MVHITLREWQIASLAGATAMAAGATLWLLTRKKPTAEELERERRQMLVSFGRIVDGSLLDGFQITAEDGTTRDMLLYQYEIPEWSTSVRRTLRRWLASSTRPVKVGMPCSIRYQPGIPENSILVAERWSGSARGLPVMWSQAEPKRDPEEAWQHLRPATRIELRSIR